MISFLFFFINISSAAPPSFSSSYEQIKIASESMLCPSKLLSLLILVPPGVSNDDSWQGTGSCTPSCGERASGRCTPCCKATGSSAGQTSGQDKWEAGELGRPWTSVRCHPLLSLLYF